MTGPNTTETQENGPKQYTQESLQTALQTFQDNLKTSLPPDWERHDLNHGRTRPHDYGYFFFMPEVPLQKGLMTVGDINTLLRNPQQNILSVGAGPAFLEQFLVSLGIKQSQIHLVDLDKTYLPKGFPQDVFNMEGKWPDFGGKRFDLILFSEAMGGATVEERVKRLSRILPSAQQVLTPNGEIRLTGYHMKEDQVAPVLAANPKLQRVGPHIFSVMKIKAV